MNVLNVVSLPAPLSTTETVKSGAEKGVSFKNIFKQVMNDVNSLQKESEDLTTKLVLGQIEDIHQVTIAAEKASLALQLTVEIRNKILDAYQEIMRMQI
jgi:flagellar hook-basal body complex protein FliE